MIIPLIVFSLILFQVLKSRSNTDLKEEAHALTGVHGLYVENFFSETIGRLESMAIYLSSESPESPVTKRMLVASQQMDSRFSNFYVVDRDGNVIATTGSLEQSVNQSDRAYFSLALLTGLTQVSEPHFGRVTGRYIVSIASPVISEEGKVLYVVVGTVQVEKLEDGLRQILHEETLRITDRSGRILMQTKKITSGVPTVSSSLQLEAVPWRVEVVLEQDYQASVMWPTGFFGAGAFALLNVVYFLVNTVLMKRRLAKELEQIEGDKLRMIGTIAAGTAHEIRNPLTGIKGFIDLLSEKYQGERDQYYFSLIQTEINRINSIVSELLIIGKPTVPSKEVFAIQPVLSEILPIIESEARLHNADVRVLMAQEPLYVMFSKDQFKQIVLNLAKNGLEALERRGQLTIVSSYAGDRIQLRIEDNGRGMSPDTLKKIFVPFFTMKDTGTGLGLVVSKRILDNYGGRLLIESKERIGTKVTIELPMARP